MCLNGEQSICYSVGRKIKNNVLEVNCVGYRSCRDDKCREFPELPTRNKFLRRLNKFLTGPSYGFFPLAHLIANPVKPKRYGKLPGNYFTKIGTRVFPDVVLDTCYRIQLVVSV